MTTTSERLKEIDQALPAEWYPNHTTLHRVELLVAQWRGFQRELADPKISTIIAALERSGLSLRVRLVKKESEE